MICHQRSEYIYICSHPQTDCFVLSELFSVARHAGRSKPGSKPVQLYVRLCFRPHDHQADHVGLGNFKVFLFLETAAAAFVHIFLYPIGYQSAQFFRRALHYASGGRIFLRQRAQPPWGSIYIYIYIYIYVCVCVCVCVRVCVSLQANLVYSSLLVFHKIVLYLSL